MTAISRIFKPDHDHYDGVRPINVYALRLFYFLMFFFVSSDAWISIFNHQGGWDHVRAVAFCVWAAYGTLSVLGLIHPLKMLPLMVFMVLYKSLWLIVVAMPLWRAGALAGSPAGEMAGVFIWVVIPIIAIPWKYFFQNYVMRTRTKAVPPAAADGIPPRAA